RAHVVDEAGEVEGDLGVGRLVRLGRGADRAGPAFRIDLDDIGNDGSGAANPEEKAGEEQGQHERAQRHQAPVVRLGAGRADALVPDLGRLLVGRDRLRRLAVAQGRTLEGHDMSPSALVLEVRTGADRSAVAFAQRTRRDQASLGEALAACEALRPRRCAASTTGRTTTWTAAHWAGTRRRPGVA